MKNFIYEDWFKIDLPNEWGIEEDHQNALLTLIRKDGAGALQISFINRLKEEENLEQELMNQVNTHLSKKDIATLLLQPSVEEKNNYYLGKTEYSIGDRYWRIWFCLNKKKMIYITYNCDMSNKDKEALEINHIVDSIIFVGK